MRRIATACATLAAAATLALTGTTSAFAAEGTLYLNRVQQINPSGCYTSEVSEPFVYNKTDQVAFVHLLPNCQGPVTGVVQPQEGAEVHGASVRIR